MNVTILRDKLRKLGYKQCSVCKDFYPNTIEFFNKNKQTADDLHYICRICRADYSRELRKNKNTPQRKGKLDRLLFKSKAIKKSEIMNLINRS
jgi:hypothetical protein